MKFESITIKDIAKALKLSVSTVSRALRDSYEISPTTKKLVTNFAREHNYSPNPIALSLKARKTMSIGVLVSEIANVFFSQVIDGIESVANSKNYNVIIAQSKESAERENMILSYISARAIDGLIVSVSSERNNHDILKQLQEKGLPIVLFDRVVDEIETHKVTLDNFAGAYAATLHLIESGYRRIACLANNESLAITRARVNGYLQAMNDKGLPPDQKLLRYCDHGGREIQEVEHEVEGLLRQKNKPQAIFTLTDKLTIETLRLLRRNGIKVPQEVALIGFSNSKDAELMQPALSIISQPAFDMGVIAAQHLFSLIEGKNKPATFEHTTLNPQLVIRESTLNNVSRSAS